MWNKLTFVMREHPGPDKSMCVMVEDVTRETKQITVLSRSRAYRQDDKSILCHKLGSRLTRRHCRHTLDMRIKSSMAQCEKIFNKRASGKWEHLSVFFSVSAWSEARICCRLEKQKLVVRVLNFIFQKPTSRKVTNRSFSVILWTTKRKYIFSWNYVAKFTNFAEFD